MTLRSVRKVVGGAIQYDGAGVKLVRVIGHADVEEFDPFLMLDAFDSQDPSDYTKGFPWHPHRGIETVTYLIHGDIEHKDSLGNKGSIRDGGCQWMTAGHGIIHQEMPQAVPRILGAQLWVNLPKKDKLAPPAYRDIRSEMIPEVREGGAVVRVLSGSYHGISGAVEGDFVKVRYLDVTLEPHVTWALDTDPGSTLFCYVVEGTGTFDESSPPVPSHRAVLLSEGERLSVKAGDGTLRFFAIAGRPLREPIAWGGPVVMNTREELHKAFAELDDGSFTKGGA